MKICFFGIFNPAYSRNSVLIHGLEENGCEVVLCRVDPKIHKGLAKYSSLIRQFRKIKNEKFDHVIVAFPGHSVVWLACLLFGRKKVIFDPFVSLYNSEVEDRRKVRSFSLRALYYWFLDWYSLHLPSTLLIDTETHLDFMRKKFFVRKDKWVVVYVGSDDRIVYPMPKITESEKIVVSFHGTSIPLQGIPIIIEAARLLENEKNIEFHFYGIMGAPTVNTKFFGRYEFQDLREILREVDIVLGIFGTSEKTGNVIPNKVYEGLAAKKAIITSSSKAISEIFINQEHMLLCENGSPLDLSAKILELAHNSVLRAHIAESGFNYYQQFLRPKALVEKMLINIAHST